MVVVGMYRITSFSSLVARSDGATGSDSRQSLPCGSNLFTHLFALGPGYHKDESTGELVATASEGIERLDAYVSRYLPQVALERAGTARNPRLYLSPRLD